jgi:ferredoxin-NADP reductase
MQSAYAQQQVATRYQYSAKTLCTLATHVGFGDAFAPGRYRTVINIHNPTERKIEITRKFALATQPGETTGSFSITCSCRKLTL